MEFGFLQRHSTQMISVRPLLDRFILKSVRVQPLCDFLKLQLKKRVLNRSTIGEPSCFKLFAFRSLFQCLRCFAGRKLDSMLVVLLSVSSLFSAFLLPSILEPSSNGFSVNTNKKKMNVKFTSRYARLKPSGCGRV